MNTAYPNSYYTVVPMELMLNASKQATLLYATVISLTNIKSGCTASDAELGAYLGLVDGKSVKKALGELVAAGWLSIEQESKDRRIFPVRPSTTENHNEKPEISKEDIKNYINNLNITQLRAVKRYVESLEAEKVMSDQKDDIDHILSAYSQLIATCRTSPKSVKIISSRLSSFTKDQITQAISNFAADSWWSSHNSHRGLSWFFKSDERIEQFINLKPRRSNGYQNENAGATEKYTKFD